MNHGHGKDITLAVWRFLKDNPHITNLRRLPYELYGQISELFLKSPLCEMFSDRDRDCVGCPISSGSDCSYRKWLRTEPGGHDNDIREQCASEIVKTLEAWNVWG